MNAKLAARPPIPVWAVAAHEGVSFFDQTKTPSRHGLR
jgi:hypothetical protein